MEIRSPQNTAYANRSGILVHVSEATRGAACGCVCVVCGGDLLAKKGQLRKHHFAHSSETNCTGAAETVLHLLSKELIEEMGSMTIPSYHFQKSRKLKNGFEVSHEQSIVNGGVVTIDSVDLETSESGFVPDVVLHSGHKKLIIEIAVTNRVKREKLRRIRNSNLPAIEIWLDEEDALLSKEELKLKLSEDVASKNWLFHPKQREAERTYLKKLRDAIRNYRPHTQINKVSSRAKNGYVYSDYSKGISSYELAIYDREVYNFYCKHKRHPNDQEQKIIWTRICK